MSTEITTAPTPAATTPAPAAAPSPAPKAESSPFSALDTRARTLPAKKEPEPKPTEEPKTEADDLKEVFDDKPPAEKPAEAKPDATKPATKPTVEAPRALREKLDTASKELETSRKELETLRQKIADHDKKNIDTTALTAKLDAREKEYQEIKAERDAARYEKSDEFKTKFEKPFQNAVGRAKEVIAQLKVTEGTDPVTGEPVQRTATWDDFADLYRMSPGRAEIEGKKLFGDNYMVVMRHLDKLRELDGDKAAALQEYQATAAQRETESKAQEVQRREKVNQAWEMTNKDIIESNPDWYGERKEDEEGNALWKESLKLVDQAYGSDREKLTLQERIALDANIRLRAAAFPRMLRENAQMKAQLAEIEKKRQQHEESLPGRVKKPAAGDQPTGELDMMDDLRKTVGNEPG